jgi:acyl-CoA reductase-like NAD-dependent aldehyde dehydrogenase
VYVSRRIARLFEERLAKECRALPHQRFTSPRVAGLIREALDDGAHLACGELLADGVLAGPLVVAGMRAGERLLSEETFAPVVAVCAVTDDSEAVRAAGRSRYGLGASIFSTDERAAHRLAGQLDAGVVVINDMIVPTADPRIPFGGRKESGFGVTRGAEGLLDFTVTKVVSVHRGGHRPHLDQPRAGDEAIFSALIRASHARKTGGRLKGVADLIAAVRGRLTKTRN